MIDFSSLDGFGEWPQDCPRCKQLIEFAETVRDYAEEQELPLLLEIATEALEG